MYRLPSLHRHLLHHLDERAKRCHCLGKPRCSFVVWVFVGLAITESNTLEADLCTRQISVPDRSLSHTALDLALWEVKGAVELGAPH